MRRRQRWGKERTGNISKYFYEHESLPSSEDTLQLYVWYIDPYDFEIFTTDRGTGKLVILQDQDIPFKVEPGHLIILQFNDYGDIIFIESRIP